MGNVCRRAPSRPCRGSGIIPKLPLALNMPLPDKPAGDDPEAVRSGMRRGSDVVCWRGCCGTA